MTYDIERLTDSPTDVEIEDIGQLCDYLTGEEVPREVVTGNVNEIVNNPSQLLFLARDVGRIVGMTLVTLKTLPHQRTAYADSIVVHPDYRERGIGTQLWDTVGEFVDARGIILQGSTSPKRAEAWKLHEQFGFEKWDSFFIVRQPRLDEAS